MARAACPQGLAQIRENFGSPSLALLPIGAYEPRWFMCRCFGVGLILTGFALQSVQYWLALLDVNIR